MNQMIKTSCYDEPNDSSFHKWDSLNKNGIIIIIKKKQ